MQSNIVEGEPGIFPYPVARLLQAAGRLFSRGDRRRPEAEADPTADEARPTDDPVDDK